jgi:glycosyltransferase involved in cell wall biosynthesis
MTEWIDNPSIDFETSLCTEISDLSVLSKIPLVSVFMITYNHSPYIAQAIEGVLQQETCFPIELIIGEDCSKDRTREIVLDFQQKYPGVIRVITSWKNVGAHKNMSRVRKACRGKYIAFCEGDDYWHDQYKLKKQVDYLENHPECGLVYSSYDIHKVKDNKTIKDFIRYRKWEIIENLKVSDYFVTLEKTGGRRVGILTCTVIIRKNLYEKIVELDPYLHNSGHFLMADTQIWVDMINISSVYFIPESMATHIITNESATRSKDIKNILRFQLSSAEIMIYLCDKYNLPPDIRSKLKKNRNGCLLRLAYYTRNADLAEDLRKTKDSWNYSEWLMYYGAKNILFHNIYSVACAFKNTLSKEHDEWQ